MGCPCLDDFINRSFDPFLWVHVSQARLLCVLTPQFSFSGKYEMKTVHFVLKHGQGVVWCQEKRPWRQSGMFLWLEESCDVWCPVPSKLTFLNCLYPPVATPLPVVHGLCMYVCMWKLLSHVRLCYHMDYSPPSSSIRWFFQARILEWVVISFPPKGIFPTRVSCIASKLYTI